MKAAESNQKAMVSLALKYCVGKRTDEAMIARRLYEILREFDENGVSYIFAESFDCSGMGQAIMNRLLKAAGHKVITI